MKTKTIQLALAALVFTIGVGVAVVQKVQAAPKAVDQVYSWTSPDQGAFSGTKSQAIDHYGCETGSALCATGTASGQPNQTLRKN